MPRSQNLQQWFYLCVSWWTVSLTVLRDLVTAYDFEVPLVFALSSSLPHYTSQLLPCIMTLEQTISWDSTREVIDLTADDGFCAVCLRCLGQGSGDVARMFVFKKSCCVRWSSQILTHADYFSRSFAAIVSPNLCQEDVKRLLQTWSARAAATTMVSLVKKCKSSSDLAARYAGDSRSNDFIHHVVSLGDCPGGFIV